MIRVHTYDRHATRTGMMGSIRRVHIQHGQGLLHALGYPSIIQYSSSTLHETSKTALKSPGVRPRVFLAGCLAVCLFTRSDVSPLTHMAEGRPAFICTELQRYSHLALPPLTPPPSSAPSTLLYALLLVTQTSDVSARPNITHFLSRRRLGVDLKSWPNKPRPPSFSVNLSPPLLRQIL